MNHKKKNDRNAYKESGMEKLFHASLLPEEAVSGVCYVTVTGQNELVAENYKGLLTYSSDKICILAGKYRVEVTGERLEILYYGREEMKIRGKIGSICYHKL